MAGKFTKEDIDKMNRKLQEDTDDYYDFENFNNIDNIDIKVEVDIKEKIERTPKECIEDGLKLAEEVKKETKEIIGVLVDNSETLQGITNIYEAANETITNINANHIDQHINHQKEINETRQDLIRSIENRNEVIETHNALAIPWPNSLLGYALIGTGVVLGLAGLGYLLRNYWSDENINNSNETVLQPTTIIVEETVVNTQTLNIGGFNIGNITNQTTVTTITQNIPQNITESNNISPEILEKLDKFIKK